MGRTWTAEERATWADFVGATAAFCHHYKPDPNPVARLIKDAVVAAYVRGAMYGQYQTGRLEMPADLEMLRQARETAEMMPEHYPALARLERGSHPDGEDDD